MARYLEVRVDVGKPLVQTFVEMELPRRSNCSPEYTPAAGYGDGGWTRTKLQRKNTARDKKGARGQLEDNGGDGRARGCLRRPEMVLFGDSGVQFQRPGGGIGVLVLGKKERMARGTYRRLGGVALKSVTCELKELQWA